MGVLSDSEICSYVARFNMIEPFGPPVSGSGLISYGLTSAGFDIRLDKTILFYKNTYGHPIDPKRFKDEEYKSQMYDKRVFKEHDQVIIPAHGYILGQSMEYFRMPRTLKGICLGKSTYCRCGILINVSPLEPSWQGHLTIEISNSSPCPAIIYIGEGIAQLEFHEIVGKVMTSYADKGGKYQNQMDVTPPRVL